MSIITRKLATFRRVAREEGSGALVRAVENNLRAVPGYESFARHVRSASVAPRAIGLRMRHTAPRLVLAYAGGIGDDLLMTVVLRELRRRNYGGVWIISEYPDLFRYNDDPELVLRSDRRYEFWMRAFGWDFVMPWYSHMVPGEDRDIPPQRHILTTMCEKAGVLGPVTLKPLLELDDDERERGRRVPNQIAVQSAGMHARFAMKTKQWFPERFQAVVSALGNDFNFVQVGARSDPPLDGALDLRGKTSVRETAAILSRSLAFVGQVGMLMHLARAVDCRGVIVYGGRELPTQSGYSCNENLYRPVFCSPCWKLNTCGHDMACMDEITPDDVVRAVRRQVARHGEPLAVDTDVITTDDVPVRTGPGGRRLATVVNVFGAAREIDAKFPREPRPDAGRVARGRSVA
ncbi:hypothetical protein tb265_36180 [Gemmatimonadetes bacterium T265]|nr:hypothetical protein tb265_36180 [Gemmatimonadetes bacterium T265]